VSDERISETLLLISSALPQVRVWRQNVAKLPNLQGRWVQFGIPGMADIGGIAGPGGWRIEIEMKRERGAHKDKRTNERQANWRRMIERFGGIYIKATNERDALAQLEVALKERTDGRE